MNLRDYVSNSEVVNKSIPEPDRAPCGVIKYDLESEEGRVTFYHVPTEDNPADVGTRGVGASQRDDLSWIVGPKWLSEEHTPRHL
ncbi:hypothetical protein NECAME_08160 [Necator americanus]|uniref:Uncharacterized protein n=1 Tax=Necator americanus TaxID=51031 RepID=W2TJ26_NECAM|nr:hypothetical protein NECAME_08160 [Necator americanus]ETN82110.1 hypothetical protein NECAME_08160 [Necator americanus]